MIAPSHTYGMPMPPSPVLIAHHQSASAYAPPHPCHNHAGRGRGLAGRPDRIPVGSQLVLIIYATGGIGRSDRVASRRRKAGRSPGVPRYSEMTVIASLTHSFQACRATGVSLP